jgi:deoxyribonuclease V
LVQVSLNRLAALDVHYVNQSAVAAAVVFPLWESALETEKHLAKISNVLAYQPGRFYLRELPCLLQILKAVGDPLDAVVIDGDVSLGSTNRPGLGMHLWTSLGERIAVIGVAKTYFHSTPDAAKLFRGGSKRPLFISAAGMALENANATLRACMAAAGFRICLSKSIGSVGPPHAQKATLRLADMIDVSAFLPVTRQTTVCV